MGTPRSRTDGRGITSTLSEVQIYRVFLVPLVIAIAETDYLA
jgi:hypothetical protein